MADWIRRRWQEFRTGYNTYLVLMMSGAQFMLIAYNFMLFRWFDNVIQASMVFAAAAVPLTVIAGHLHNAYQQDTDAIMWLRPVVLQLDRIEKALIKERRCKNCGMAQPACENRVGG